LGAVGDENKKQFRITNVTAEEQKRLEWLEIQRTVAGIKKHFGRWRNK